MTYLEEEEDLFAAIKRWSYLAGWVCTEIPPEKVYIDATHSYFTNVHGLTILIGGEEDKIKILPQGYKKDGTAVFEISAWPTLVRVRLMKHPNRKDYDLYTDSGIPFHHPWNEETFVRLVKDMINL